MKTKAAKPSVTVASAENTVSVKTKAAKAEGELSRRVYKAKAAKPTVTSPPASHTRYTLQDQPTTVASAENTVSMKTKAAKSSVT